MPTLLAVPDKFRGTLSAGRAATAMASAAREAGWEAAGVALSDGGEGFLEVYGSAIGAVVRRTQVTGPLGEPVEAEWALAGRTAVVEMARASGLELAGGEGANDPLGATTAGTGELICAAASAGAKRIVVGCGGSATTDGGEGALSAMRPMARLAGVEIVVACDVRTPFLEAAERFSAQKGASSKQVGFLTRRLEALAERYRGEWGIDVTTLVGAGAAGGLAGGLAAAGAKLVPGFDVVAEAVGLQEKIAGADLVVTGEGLLDAESFQGKVVGEVNAMCKDHRIPLLVVVGEVVEEPEPGRASFPVISLSESFGMERARAQAATCIADAVRSYLESSGRT